MENKYLLSRVDYILGGMKVKNNNTDIICELVAVIMVMLVSKIYLVVAKPRKFSKHFFSFISWLKNKFAAMATRLREYMGKYMWRVT